MKDLIIDFLFQIAVDLDPALKEGIATAKQRYLDFTGSLNVETKQSSKFGKNVLKSCKVSPDSIMQLAFQVRIGLFLCEIWRILILYETLTSETTVSTFQAQL